MGLVEKTPVPAAASTMEPGKSGMPFYRFIPGADASGHESVIPMTDEGNWDDLPRELVSKVDDILLRCDLTDFVRLTTVKPWRDAVTGTAPKLMGMNPRFFPRHWKMLVQTQGEKSTRFVNVLTGACIRVQIPQEHGQVVASGEGCLLLASAPRHKVCLFNPVTGAVTDLPTLFFCIKVNGGMITQDIKAAGIIYDTEGEGEAVPTPTVVLLVAVFSIDMLKYARPGDTVSVWQWRHFAPSEDGELPLLECEGGLSLGGSFYVPTRTGDVLKLELQPQPHFVYAARQHEATDHLHLRSYLVPSVDAGMLLVVCRFENHAGYVVTASHVFQVNLTEGTLSLLEDRKDIGNQSIFHRWLTLGTQ